MITLIRFTKTVSINNIFDWESTTDWHLVGWEPLGNILYIKSLNRKYLAPYKNNLVLLSTIRYIILFLMFGRFTLQAKPRANCWKYSPMEGSQLYSHNGNIMILERILTVHWAGKIEKLQMNYLVWKVFHFNPQVWTMESPTMLDVVGVARLHSSVSMVCGGGGGKRLYVCKM